MKTSWRPSSKFVFRSPLLPLDRFATLADRLSEKSAAERVECVRHRLRSILEDPHIREAVFLASPVLYSHLKNYYSPGKIPTKRFRRLEHSLIRYFSRMCSRSTPFGLFSGVGVGRIGHRVSLETGPISDHRSRARLDNDYLYSLTAALKDSEDIYPSLKWYPNPGLYYRAGQARYVEVHLDDKTRTYHRVGIGLTPLIQATLEYAKQGALVSDLVDHLRVSSVELCGLEIDSEETHSFIKQLIDCCLLVTDLEPPITGDEPLVYLLDRLSSMTPELDPIDHLDRVKSSLGDLDRKPIGRPVSSYHQIAQLLEPLPVGVEISRLFQVDLVKKATEATLSHKLVDKIIDGIHVLWAIQRRMDPLKPFRDKFYERYEDAEIPLLHALDEDSGIGFGDKGAPGSEGSPLLLGLPFPPLEDEPGEWRKQDTYLLGLLHKAWADQSDEIRLTKTDITKLSDRGDASLPSALSVMCALLGDKNSQSEEKGKGINEKSLRILLRSVVGPSGARLLGRFCHASAEIEDIVRDHLQAEEALEPEKVFAEIVYLSEGRIGNIVCRPVLRKYEIPVMGLSGAAKEHQLSLQDLTLSVYQNRLILRSKSLGCEVVPRMSTAHNYGLSKLPTYRFLCALQDQRPSFASWSWGPLEEAPYLPRVTHRNFVFSPAQWFLSESDILPLRKTIQTGVPGQYPGAEQQESVLRCVRDLRRSRKLPRYVLVADADHHLLVDFDNPLSAESFAWLIHRRSSTTLVEQLQGSGGLVAQGPEGSYCHELVLSLTRSDKVKGSPTVRSHREMTPAVPAPAIQRGFSPGSEWLYFKIYTGAAVADRVLTEVVAPVKTSGLASGALDKWFFLRLRDPYHHLRVRFHGSPDRLLQEVLPAVHDAAQPLIADGTIWKTELSTYHREIERYGGPLSMELNEDIFSADSDAVLRIVELLDPQEGLDARWRLALRGVDMLLEDLRLSLDQRLEIMRDARNSFELEFRADKGLHKAIGLKLRQERQELFKMLSRDPAVDASHPLQPGFEPLQTRSQTLVHPVESLYNLDREGRLNPRLVEFAWSLVHMHVNRLVHAGQRAHELVLYDFLFRWYTYLKSRRHVDTN